MLNKYYAVTAQLTFIFKIAIKLVAFIVKTSYVRYEFSCSVGEKLIHNTIGIITEIQNVK
jgi:hypothetical protein